MRVPKLEELRTKAFLTQDSLSARSGVSRDTISKLETGERVNAHTRTVAKLASALNVEPWQLQGLLSPPDDFLATDAKEEEKSGRFSLGGRLGGRPRVRRAELRVTDSELQSVLYAYRRSMEEHLPEDTPSEALLNFEWMALVVQGHGYEEARARAQERVYGSEQDLREEDSAGDQGFLRRQDDYS
jgi:transcriptional regulator with XRE-family HTH domain